MVLSLNTKPPENGQFMGPMILGEETPKFWTSFFKYGKDGVKKRNDTGEIWWPYGYSFHSRTYCFFNPGNLGMPGLIPGIQNKTLYTGARYCLMLLNDQQ